MSLVSAVIVFSRKVDSRPLVKNKRLDFVDSSTEHLEYLVADPTVQSY